MTVTRRLVLQAAFAFGIGAFSATSLRAAQQDGWQCTQVDEEHCWYNCETGGPIGPGDSVCVHEDQDWTKS